GYAALQGDHIDEIVKLASSKLPGITIATDGAAHPLPALLPFPGHVAATRQAFGLALGPGSAATATELVTGAPAPAPLPWSRVDYPRLGALLSDAGKDLDEEARAVIAALATVTLSSSVDDSGLSWRMSVELR